MPKLVDIERVTAHLRERAAHYAESGSRGTLGNCDNVLSRTLRSYIPQIEALVEEETPKPERTWEEACANEEALRDRLPWGSRWRHKKRGTTYSVQGLGMFQDATGSGEHDMELCVLYWSEERESVCVRRAVEFLDGRFERIDG